METLQKTNDQETLNRSFYYGVDDKTKINNYLLRGFLTEEGFGQFQSSKNRLSKKKVMRNNDGVLEPHNSYSIKIWLRKYFESIPETEFEKGQMWSGTEGGGTNKFTILSLIQRFKISEIESILNTLDVHSQFGYKDTSKLHLFNDTSGVAHIRFLNGVVRVTKDDIQLIDYSSIKSDGAVWESSIIDRDIKIDPKKGLYEMFCERAMSYHNPDKKSDVWMDNYDLNEEQLRDIALISLANNIDGLIISNTSISRPKNLKSITVPSIGGLSGKPIFQISNDILKKTYNLTNGQIPLIGVGGISNGADCYQKIKSGASLVQLYTALIYSGPLLIKKIKSELTYLLKTDGYKNIAEAVGKSV